MAHSKDLFDDSTMTFGEHLECLRVHLIKALIGLFIAVIAALFYGDKIVDVVRAPIDDALQAHGSIDYEDDLANGPPMLSWPWWKEQFGFKETPTDPTGETEGGDTVIAGEAGTGTGRNKTDIPLTEDGQPLPLTDSEYERTIRARVMPSELARVLHEVDPQKYPEPAEAAEEQAIVIRLAAPEFTQLERVIERQNQAVTLNVQEAFMTYIKVAFIAGLLASSPWVLHQLWLFVAAGLYPHERRYVYTYLPISVILFTGGSLFCFFAVFPFVLKFLLGFNALLGVQPQIRLSEWISFAISLPVMFGISFELPMVMLFLERISIFSVEDYREKRRISTLVIAFLSMMLTPADPMSMLLMMFPLLLLYELGIFLCVFNPSKSGFEDQPAPAG